MPGRHTEYFGPDYGRGPFASSNPETAAIQIASALAQLRVPIQRDDDAIRAHAEFIRELAEQLVPEMATFVQVTVGESDLGRTVTFRVNPPQRVLLRVWLADSYGGGQTNMAADSIIWITGTIVQTVWEHAHYIIATDGAGLASATIIESGPAEWYWGVARGARVFYAGPMVFE